MSMMGYWDSLVRGAASPASIDRLGVVSEDEDFLAYILAHPDLGQLHAEAMERAKA